LLKIALDFGSGPARIVNMMTAKKKRFIKVSVPLEMTTYDDLQRRAAKNKRSKGKEVLCMIEAALYGKGK